MKRTIGIACAIGVLSSCTYDNLELGNCADVEGCADIPISTSFIGYQENMQGVHYGAPCFNPNNPDEFVYLEQDWTSGVPENSLVIYNMSSGTSTVILESVYVIAEPIWTLKNEIYFWHSSWDIYRIMPDGSGYQNVTSLGGCRYPVVNPAGTLLYFYYNPNNDINTGLIMDTETLQVVDTIAGSAYSDWSIDDLLVNGQGSTFVGTLDVQTNVHSIIYDYEIPHYTHAIHDVKFTSDGNSLIYSAYLLGMHRVNLFSKSHTQLKWSCDTRDFRSISIHPNGKQMLVQLVKNKKVSESQIDVTSEIWMMDTDGCNAHQVLP